MDKQAQTLNRRANPAMHYIPCYGGEANVLMRHNVLCMSSGTCTHYQISTKLSVPLLIHGVSHSIL